MISDPALLVVDEGPVRVMTLNRPDRRNAMDMEMRGALDEALRTAMTDPSVRALVITGAGGAFCAGGDIATMEGLTGEEIATRITVIQQIASLVRGGAKPVVAAVEGPAVGAGLSLALACDRVVAGRGATLGAVFVRVGLAADMGIAVTLPERVGVARARQLLMFGEVLAGEAAFAEGLVDVLVEEGGALASAIADAHRLADGPPLALAAIKRLLTAPPVPFEAALAREGAAQQALLASADLAEGAAAFRERRTPRFEGR